jgi:NADH dehydrogenase
MKEQDMILVTGGTGLVGSTVVRELVQQGKPVAVMSHRPEPARQKFSGMPVEVRAGDARDAGSLTDAVRGVDTVISAMQFPNFPVENRGKGYTFEEIDARGNERLVAAAKEAGARSYVYLSGIGVAPDGKHHWHRAKWRAEEAVRNSGLRYTIIRPSWVYGPEDNALNRIAGFARRLPFIPVIGSGNQRMQPVYVGDVARVVTASLENPSAANQTFEIGGPEILTMNEIIRTVLEVMGKRKPLIHAPAFLPWLAGWLMVQAPISDPPLSPETVAFATAAATANNSALLRAFPDLRLTPLRAGLETYLAPTRPAMTTMPMGGQTS